MTDDQTNIQDDDSSSDNGVTLNSDQIMELLRRAHDSTPPKPPAAPKSPYQQVQPQQPAPPVNDYNPSGPRPAPQGLRQGQVRDQATGAAISPGTADRVAWTRQQGDKLQQQDQDAEKQQAQVPQNTWQQMYSALKKANPGASPQQLLMSMKAYKDAGAFDIYTKNQMGKTVPEQLYASRIAAGDSPAEAAKVVEQYNQGGSLSDLEAKKKAMSEGTAEGKISAAAPALAAKQKTAAQDTIRTINGLDNHIYAALKNVSSGTAGVFGNLVKGIYQPAADLEATLGSIGSAVGFQQLQEMRKNSPTGAALGRVTNFEMEMLQSTLASLKQKQSPEQLTANLKTVKRISDEIRDAIEEDQKKGINYDTASEGVNAAPSQSSSKSVNWSDLP